MNGTRLNSVRLGLSDPTDVVLADGMRTFVLAYAAQPYSAQHAASSQAFTLTLSNTVMQLVYNIAVGMFSLVSSAITTVYVIVADWFISGLFLVVGAATPHTRFAVFGQQVFTLHASALTVHLVAVPASSSGVFAMTSSAAAFDSVTPAPGERVVSVAYIERVAVVSAMVGSTVLE